MLCCHTGKGITLARPWKAGTALRVRSGGFRFVPELSVASIIRKWKISGEAFFRNECTTSLIKAQNLQCYQWTARHKTGILNGATFVPGGKRSCGKILSCPAPQLYLKAGTTGLGDDICVSGKPAPLLPGEQGQNVLPQKNYLPGKRIKIRNQD